MLDLISLSPDHYLIVIGIRRHYLRGKHPHFCYLRGYTLPRPIRLLGPLSLVPGVPYLWSLGPLSLVKAYRYTLPKDRGVLYGI